MKFSRTKDVEVLEKMNEKVEIGFWKSLLYSLQPIKMLDSRARAFDKGTNKPRQYKFQF